MIVVVVVTQCHWCYQTLDRLLQLVPDSRLLLQPGRAFHQGNLATGGTGSSNTIDDSSCKTKGIALHCIALHCIVLHFST
jgi:hypothetical protein